MLGLLVDLVYLLLELQEVFIELEFLPPEGADPLGLLLVDDPPHSEVR